MQNLETLTKEQTTRLRQELTRKKLIVIVHPFFGTNNAQLTRFLAEQRHEKYVMLIMDAKEMRRGIELLALLKTKKQENILFLETIKKTNPRPVIGWKEFIRLLEKIGTKKIIVGGRLLTEISLYDAETAKKEWAEIIQKIIAEKKTAEEKETLLEARRHYAKNRDAAKALRITKQRTGNFFGCAGRTATKLTNARKFKVKTTKHLT
jgi:hypothetical protein